MKTKKYTISYLLDEGGSANFYKLKESKNLAFKEFRSKQEAQFAYKIQQKLSKLGLAPKIYGKIHKQTIECEGFYAQDKWYSYTGWGYITQIVRISKRLSRKKIQELVDKIYIKTKLKFWDCHEYNIGKYRNNYVCIDTGKESFDNACNAWGMKNPGPKCEECNKYRCYCQ